MDFSKLEQYKRLISHLPVGIYKIDMEGKLLEANNTMCRMLKYNGIDELKDINFNNHFKTVSSRKKHLKKLDESEIEFAEFKIICKDKTLIWVRDYIKKVQKDDEFYYEGVWVDITKQKNFKSEIFRRGIILEGVSYAAQQLLKSSSWSSSISSILEQIGYSTGVNRVYIFHYDLENDNKEVESYTWLHPIFEIDLKNPELSDFPMEMDKSDGWHKKLENGEFIFGKLAEFDENISAHLEKNNISAIMLVPIFVSGKYWGFIGLDNNLRQRAWTELEIEALKTATNIIGAAVERNYLLDKLERIAVTDELTDILNRRGFILLGEQHIKQISRSHQPTALIFIDMDGLKWINDNLGHEEGDRAICDMADILKLTFRDSDIIGRIGGDEFVALLSINREQTEKILLARLKGNINDFNREHQREYKLSASLGVSYFDFENENCSLDFMMKTADDLMFEAKKKKKLKRGHKPT